MLPVKVGLITEQVFFSIVEDLGPYNATMGWAWLHSMKSIPSTYHHMVNYLTSVGQVDRLKSQKATRQCYQLSAREQRREKSFERHPLYDQTST